MSNQEAHFGSALYRELKALGDNGSRVTSRFNYAELQKLKVANRAEVIKLFPRSTYAMLQILKNDSPAQIAAFLGDNEDKHQAETQMIFASILLGLSGQGTFR